MSNTSQHKNRPAHTLTTRDDSTSVAHAATWGSSTTSNEADNWLGVGTRLVVFLQVLGSFLLHTTANLTNEDEAYKNVKRV